MAGVYLVVIYTKMKSFNIFKLWIKVETNTLGMVSFLVHA